jgi:hypothetical protein
MPYCRPVKHVTKPLTASRLQSLTLQMPFVQVALLTVTWVAWAPTMKLAASAACSQGWGGGFVLGSSSNVCV